MLVISLGGKDVRFADAHWGAGVETGLVVTMVILTGFIIHRPVGVVP